jgi:DNA-binding NarL/FixJ family response regulator
MKVSASHTGNDAAPVMDVPEAMHRIFIVGRNVFQNQLVKTFLEDLFTRPCDITVQEEWHEISEDRSAPPPLALMDCYGVDVPDLWRKFGLGSGPDPVYHAVALFNIAPGSRDEIEFEAIEHSIRGIFYLNEPPELLAKGIEKILGGEIWFSRKTTSQFLLDPKRFHPRSQAMEAMLTAREKEILVAIASGSGNTEISDEFNISLNTVKTHVYNIYKKIDVRNRLEATLWVARYL